MRFAIKDLNLQQLVKQRNFAYVVAGGLLFSNLFLAMKMHSMEERWILIPQFDNERRASVSTDSYSDEYLIDWADAILKDLLIANPASIDRKAARVLDIAVSSYGNMKTQIRNLATKIKQDEISTVFYPQQFNILRSKNEVEVSGEFLTHFGQDKVPISQQKTFVLEFQRGSNGVILISGFKEVTDEEVKDVQNEK